MEGLIFSPTDFVAVFNQTVSAAYPIVEIEGEVSNFRIAKEKWVYFDIKDEYSSLKVFGTVYQLAHAIEDGMMVRLRARPELHPLYNFSLQMVDVRPSGEGSIKKSFDILFAKLTKEGLFDTARKRTLPYPPARIGLITSNEAAAYGDFMKVLSARWPLMEIELANVRVQGDSAAGEIVAALHHFNLSSDPVEVLVIIRGGGSSDDLLAFADEHLTRAIAESRIPTLVAIGHERDESLAELAADVRASTPSNAAELIAPSKDEVLALYQERRTRSREVVGGLVQAWRRDLEESIRELDGSFKRLIQDHRAEIKRIKEVLMAYNPNEVLRRGYALVKSGSGKIIRSVKQTKSGDEVKLTFHDGEAHARVIG
jgi:exodeoxyribonuclease VII large subunit